MSLLRCALPKGNNKAISKLFNQAGIPMSAIIDESRQYKIHISDFEFILVKPKDVPTFVEFGAADIGIVGKDVLLEVKKEIIELLDLKTNETELVILSSKDELETVNIDVATSYPNISTEYFKNKGIHAKNIILNGNLNLAFELQFADAIVDLITNKQDLQSNSTFVDTICKVSDRLIVNRASYILKNAQIESISSKLRKLIDNKA
ncbi:ATP phosphoribosyltransferase (homohexameric) [Paenibacillus sp. 1_12]|uniref:ATP phosphoribosyltransferase n=1 Tax=Paenibacillus sp. 1_12 TaxID=1566278 RepID=UPI0008DFADBA|nr:ATP phosphoribosyltransferase [Paenibacillus sp. 1_12]SFL34616.1 ATP phosphoribosyltransferase (homohexameric) [Paenibacillus sp. 1_12]